MADDATLEQAMLHDQVGRFVRSSGSFGGRGTFLEKGGDAANWTAFAENGWLGAGFAEEDGGFGGGPVEIAIVVGELGRALALEPTAANIIGGTIIARLAPSPTRAELLERMIAGALCLSPAVVEPSGSHDWRHCDTTVTLDGAGYRLNGRKIVAPAFAPGVPDGRFLVLARADDADWRVALVRPNAGGVDTQEYALIDNTRACDLAFKDVAVDAAECLPLTDAQVDAVMNVAAFVTCAETVGVMNETFDMTVDYVRQRKQFGAPLGANQALQHRLVDMMMALRDAESLTRRAGELLADNGAQADDVAAAVAAAKIQCSTAARLIAQEAVQMHGGIGTTDEAPISHYFKRLVLLGRLYGDAAFHRKRLASLMERADIAAAALAPLAA